MQTIKLNGQKGDEIALEYKGSTLIVKLDDDAIVPDFVEVLIRALKLDAYRVANTCVDFYHRGTAPEDPFRARFAQSRDLLFESIAPEQSVAPEPEVEQDPDTESETKTTKRAAKKSAKTIEET